MTRICVFVGANEGADVKYTESTKQLGKEIASKNIDLVYGGANVGQMGVLANSVLDSGGHVIGVMPKQFLSKEITHHELTELHIVDTIQDRKKLMAELADAFLVLPGGIGTLEETFEIWNALKVNAYKKPLGFLNIDEYFNLLFEFLNKTLSEGLTKKEHLDLAVVSNNPISLVNSIYKMISSYYDAQNIKGTGIY